MSILRVVALSTVLAAALFACGGAGSGGANGPSQRFTPIPAGSPAGSPDPSYGY